MPVEDGTEDRQRIVRGPTGCEPSEHEHAAVLAEVEGMAYFGHWSFDLLSGVPGFSDEALRLLGFSPNQAADSVSRCRDNVHIDDQARIMRLVHAALRRGKSFDTPLRIVRPDGGLRWLRVTARRHPVAAHRLLGVVFDITLGKRVEMQQRVELEVARLFAGTVRLAEVVGKIICIICRTLGLEWGAFWTLDETTKTLRLLRGSNVDNGTYGAFERASRRAHFRAGTGLVGSVFESGEPRWVTDTSLDGLLLGPNSSIQSGLKGGFAFPVSANGRVFGVLEFCSRFARQPDASILTISRTLDVHIGQFMESKPAEERIHYLANRDQLTGLLNRRSFSGRLDRAIKQARRHKR